MLIIIVLHTHAPFPSVWYASEMALKRCELSSLSPGPSCTCLHTASCAEKVHPSELCHLASSQIQWAEGTPHGSVIVTYFCNICIGRLESPQDPALVVKHNLSRHSIMSCLTMSRWLAILWSSGAHLSGWCSSAAFRKAAFISP